MKRVLRRFSITMMIILMVSLMAPQVFAASSVSISGGDNVKGGDTFYIAVNFEGGDIGRVDAQMSYDTSKLTYISGGTSDGNVGYINLNKAGTGGGVTFNIKFQALKDGSTDVNVITYEMYDLNEKFIQEAPQASKTITIKGSASEDQLVKQETSPDKPVEFTGLMGVDEMEDETGEVNLNLILIIAAAVLVLLIVVVSIVLVKKRK